MSVAVDVRVVSVLISGASLGEGVGQCGRTPDIAGVLTVTHHNMHSTQYSYCTVPMSAVLSTTMGEIGWRLHQKPRSLHRQYDSLLGHLYLKTQRYKYRDRPFNLPLFISSYQIP